MISSVLSAGLIAYCATQLSASPVNVADEHDDVSVMLAVGSFTRIASSREVQHKAGDVVSHRRVQHNDVEAEVLSIHTDIKHFGDLLHGHLSLEWIHNMLHSEPLPLFAVFASALVVLAASCACFCSWGFMRKGRRGSQFEDSEPVEVWERIGTCTVQEESLLALFKEIDESNQSPESPPGYINAIDLHKMMQDKRVANKLVELGIPTADFLHVFHVFESSAGTHNGCVNLKDFIKANESHEGHLMKLFSMLDEANQSAESPPGCITRDVLRAMMQNKKVARQFYLLGISDSDSWAVFNVLRSSPQAGHVNLRDFIAGCKKLAGRRW